MPKEKIGHKLIRIATVPLAASVLIGLVVWLILAIVWQDWTMNFLLMVEGAAVLTGGILGAFFAIIYFLADRAERLSRF